MAITKHRALEIVLNALVSANDELSADARFDITVDTVLFGADAQIDSLTLVSLIVDVEQAVDEEVGTAISLTDEKAMMRNPSPFHSADTLADYIVEICSED